MNLLNPEGLLVVPTDPAFFGSRVQFVLYLILGRGDGDQYVLLCCKSTLWHPGSPLCT